MSLTFLLLNLCVPYFLAVPESKFMCLLLSCCSRVQVYVSLTFLLFPSPSLCVSYFLAVPEFNILRSHIEWNLLNSLCDNNEKFCCKLSTTKHNSKLKLVFGKTFSLNLFFYINFSIKNNFFSYVMLLAAGHHVAKIRPLPL